MPKGPIEAEADGQIGDAVEEGIGRQKPSRFALLEQLGPRMKCQVKCMPLWRHFLPAVLVYSIWCYVMTKLDAWSEAGICKCAKPWL